MKKVLFITIAVLLAALSSYAQVPAKPFNLYAGGGLTLGSAPQEFTDYHKEGYHLMGGLGLNLIPLIQFVGKVEYHSFSKDFNEFFPSITDLDGGTRRILMLGVDARLGADVPTAPITPFLFAGLGLASISESDLQTAVEIAVDEYDSETELYINLGGGIEFKFLQVLNVFVQGKYVNIKQAGDNLVVIPVTVGIKL
ncbi:MAG: outer membrane beta-barrel protein [Candidatus Zixiibacteriota bacterium]|nr:MAG: outer membrane beta-barrel protein [candidate division Zixibacteria bacterium]